MGEGVYINKSFLIIFKTFSPKKRERERERERERSVLKPKGDHTINGDIDIRPMKDLLRSPAPSGTP